MTDPLQNPVDNSLTHIKRESLRHTVRGRIEQAILTGELKGGERLNEVEIAHRLGVSRGLVREALRELETSGIIVSVPYRGTFVKEWTAKGVAELYTLRSQLEEYAVELAVQRATEADLKALSGLVQSMYRAAQAGDAMELVDLDLQFHQRLYAISDHSLLLRVLTGLSGQTHMFIMATKALYSLFPTLEEAAASHEEILEAIRARDPQACRRAIREHICHVGEHLVQRLAEAQKT